MTKFEATIVTTPVPMRGYEEALLGTEVCFARLHDLSHTLQPWLWLEAPDFPYFADLAPLQGSWLRYDYMKESQFPPMQCFLLPSGLESAPEPEDDPRFKRGDHGYLDAVRSAYLSFFVAAIKACAKGELTKPIVLRGQASVGGEIDLRSGKWIVRCKGGQDLTDNPDVLIHCRPALYARAFMESVYDLGQRDLRAATDKVFDTIDRLLCDGREELCDEILASVEVARLPSALLRSFLTITAPAKERLHSRPSYFAKAYAEVERQRGPDMAKRLLGRLA